VADKVALADAADALPAALLALVAADDELLEADEALPAAAD